MTIAVDRPFVHAAGGEHGVGARAVAIAFVAAYGVGMFCNGLAELPLLVWSMLALVPAALMAAGRLLRSAQGPERYAVMLGAVLAYALWAGVSMAASVAPAVSFQAMGFVLAPAMGLVVGLALREAYGSFGTYLVLALPAGAAVLAGAAEHLVFDLPSHATLRYGPLMDRNNFGWLAMALPLPLAALGCVAGGRWARWGGAAVTPAAFAMAALAGSRGALALGVVAYGGLAVLAALRLQRLLPLVGVAVGVGGVIVATLLARATAETADPVAGLASTGGIGVRLELIRSALAILADHPLTGSGLLTFFLLYPQYRFLEEQGTAGVYVHNDWAQFLQEGGVPLFGFLLAFAGFVAFAWWRWLRALWRCPEDAQTWLRFGALGAVGVLLAAALLNFTLYVLPLGLAVGMLAAVGWPEPKPRHGAWVALLRERGRRLLAAFGVAAALTGYVLVVDALNAGILGVQPGVPGAGWVKQNPARYFAAARWLQALNPSRAMPFYAQGATLAEGLASERPAARREAVRLARPLFERAVDRDPWNAEAFVEYATLLRNAPGAEDGRYDERIEALMRHALTIRPTHPVYLARWVNHLQARGRPEAARRVLEERYLPWCTYIARLQPEGAAYLLEKARAARAPAGAPSPERVAREVRCEVSVASVDARQRRETLGFGERPEGALSRPRGGGAAGG